MTNKLAVVVLLVALGHRCTGFPWPSDESQDESIFDIILADRTPVVSSDDEVVAGDKPSADHTDSIVGGQDTTILDHPYQVSFLVDDRTLCGGFIVSEEYVVTAAHCVQGVDPSTVVLRAGSSFRSNGTVFPVAEIMTHPQHNQPKFNKDVAVMRMGEKFQFTDSIQPIKLAKKGRRMVGGSKIVISGWGRTHYGASASPERLMEVEIPVVDHPQCQPVYPTILTDSEFCAGNFFLGGQGTCQGDSGGAATQDGQAVGIVSFGRGCGQPLSPSVFADIASGPIRDFITEKTGL